MHTQGYSGPKYWTAGVFTSDPHFKEITLTVKAFVKPVVTVLPKRVLFESSAGESASREVTVKAEGPRPLALTPGPFSLSGQVTYRIEEIEKGRRFRVVLQRVPGGAGAFHGFLLLQTGYPEKPEIRIMISGDPLQVQRP